MLIDEANACVALIANSWSTKFPEPMREIWRDRLMDTSLIEEDVRGGVEQLVVEQAYRPALATIIDAGRKEQRERFANMPAIEGQTSDGLVAARQRMFDQTGKSVSPSDDDLLMAGQLAFKGDRYVKVAP